MNKPDEPPPSRVTASAGMVFILVLVAVAAIVIAIIKNARPSQDDPNGMPQNIGEEPASEAPPTSPAAPR